MHREKDQRHIQVQRPHVAGDLHSILARHIHVEHGYVGAAGLNQFQRLLTISGLRNHLQTNLTLDDLAQTLAENRMILGDQNPDFSSHWPFLLRCLARERE